MTEPDPPRPAFAVSPDDQSSDREQSDANQVVNAASLNELVGTSRALTDATNAAAFEARRGRRRFMVVMVGIATVIACICGAVLVILLAGSPTSKQIADCVQPKGHCFKQSQQRTAAVVGTLNQIAVLAAACAPDYVQLPLPTRTVAIRDCIERGLKH